MKSTAWLYCAVSSSPQEITLDSQEQWGQQTAKVHGWTITRTFKGVSSGKTGTRKLLDDLLAELRATPKAARPERLLLVRIDRLGRGTGLEGIAALAELKKLGVAVWTREDGEVKIERASDTILPAIRTIVAALENEARSDRVRAGQARRRAAGKHLGAVPYGTVLVEGKPVAYEPEAAIVREIFDLLAAGWGLERIAGHVRSKAPPKRQGDGSERRLTWGQSTVRSIYLSEVVRAIVVSPEALAQAEAARAENYRYRPTGEWDWPLRGAVRCTCGHLLMGMATGVDPYRIRYYRCRSHPYDQRGPGNRSPGYRADALEASFAAILTDLAAHPAEVMRKPRASSAERLAAQETALRTQLARLDRRRRRACELAEDGAYSPADLRDRLDRIESDRRAISMQLEALLDERRSIVTAAGETKRLEAVLRHTARSWKRMPIKGRQAVAQAVSRLLGGLYADARRPGVLVPRHVADLRKVKTKSSCRCNPKSSTR